MWICHGPSIGNLNVHLKRMQDQKKQQRDQGDNSMDRAPAPSIRIPRLKLGSCGSQPRTVPTLEADTEDHHKRLSRQAELVYSQVQHETLAQYINSVQYQNTLGIDFGFPHMCATVHTCAPKCMQTHREILTPHIHKSMLIPKNFTRCICT